MNRMFLKQMLILVTGFINVGRAKKSSFLVMMMISSFIREMLECVCVLVDVGVTTDD